jgi:hypothetical protein
MSTAADPSGERAAEEFEMVKVASSIRLEAKPGKEKEVEQFLLDLRCISRRCGTAGAPFGQGGGRADGESIRPVITSSEHREGRRVGGETAGMRSTP